MSVRTKSRPWRFSRDLVLIKLFGMMRIYISIVTGLCVAAPLFGLVYEITDCQVNRSATSIRLGVIMSCWLFCAIGLLFRRALAWWGCVSILSGFLVWALLESANLLGRRAGGEFNSNMIYRTGGIWLSIAFEIGPPLLLLAMITYLRS